MARALRIQIAGGIFHVWSRGNRRQAIYVDDADRERFLALLLEVARRFGWIIHGYVLLDNHYHLIVETPREGTLSRGMQRLNGVYAQYFNRRHCLDGHLFQGRYGSRQITTSEQLVTLLRYLAWNPVQAGLCAGPAAWPGSSVRRLLPSARVLGCFGANPSTARRRYRQFLLEAAPRAP